MRGFEIAKGFENSGVILPKRGTERSAGYDIALIEDITVPPGEIVSGKTGLKAFMNDDEVLFIYNRSSLAKKYGLTLANNVGVIDADYYSNPGNDGHIMVMLYNFTDKEINLNRGERVAQGIFQKYLTVSNEEAITTKREGGFGSTGKLV